MSLACNFCEFFFSTPDYSIFVHLPCVWNRISHRLMCILDVAVVVRSAGPCFSRLTQAADCWMCDSSVWCQFSRRVYFSLCLWQWSVCVSLLCSAIKVVPCKPKLNIIDIENVEKCSVLCWLSTAAAPMTCLSLCGYSEQSVFGFV